MNSEDMATLNREIARGHDRPKPAPRVRYVGNIMRIAGPSAEQLRALAHVAEIYPFRASTYYLNLIDWSDPTDPIRRLIIPQLDELQRRDDPDPGREE